MNPFNLTEEYVREKLSGKKNIWLANRIVRQLEEFKKERPDLLELDLNELKSPIETFQNAFNAEEVGFYNGQNKKTRIAEKMIFNDDNGKKKILVVQSNAGEAGISLHDTTGTYQRVLINLGMPTRPTATIQIEGRIYRVGNKSNAVFRYLNTGTVMEGEMFSKNGGTVRHGGSYCYGGKRPGPCKRQLTQPMKNRRTATVGRSICRAARQKEPAAKPWTM